MKSPKNYPHMRDSATFASAFGQAVWLMTLSKGHRDLKIKQIEDLVTPAIFLQQFKIYSQGKRPVAFLSWASVSDDIKSRFDAGDRTLRAEEWRSGKHIVVVDCVSPFADRAEIEKQFWESVGDPSEKTS